jgi:RNA polymerase-associated protein CTR9
LGRFLKQLSNDVFYVFKKGCILYYEGEYEKALECFQNALKYHPKCNPSVRLGIGHCFAKLGKSDMAKKAFLRLLNIVMIVDHFTILQF